MLFRTDLRLGDHRALAAAAASGKPVVPVFVREPDQSGARAPGAARRWWLHHSLERLAAGFENIGAPLVLRSGETAGVVDELIGQTGADTVLWNRRYDPAGIAADKRLKASLHDRGLSAESFEGHLLHEPSRLTTTTGGYYKVYTPFWRALEGQPEPRAPVDAPKSLRRFERGINSERLDAWRLLPKRPDWAGGLRDAWTPGEQGAQKQLRRFLDDAIEGYATNRDFPAGQGTSRLSPHLAHGEITPYQIFGALRSELPDAPAKDIARFRMELGWREFSYHLLFHNPDLATENFNRAFDTLPWRADPVLLGRWQRGETGYPIVDAGMRELWQTGWMHNRVRMVVASFLTKHLLIDWRDGEAWFWDTLIDADPANNPASWQWVAGCGADAAPYFRVFNPVLQGEKFDPEGAYVRRFVPEIARLPDAVLHRPWTASAAQLSAAGVKLGETYPVPLVDHNQARERALAAYAGIKGEQWTPSAPAKRRAPEDALP